VRARDPDGVDPDRERLDECSLLVGDRVGEAEQGLGVNRDPLREPALPAAQAVAADGHLHAEVLVPRGAIRALAAGVTGEHGDPVADLPSVDAGPDRRDPARELVAHHRPG
jgi:hypothetical protein